ncbi:MAG: pyrroline-5-carboxylate reductase [Candidatus Omnitrophica bacterium]|nr:pyrroline-5-carboxylate reductase [Candidatus Omnitrophota bacterium]
MIGIIGAGNMGKAIALCINERLLINDVDPAMLRFKKTKYIFLAGDNINLTKRASLIILAVKPQCIIKVLEEIKPHVKGKLIVSIAAGIKTDLLEKVLGKARVVRVMPNMPLLVGKGISAITRGRFATERDLVCVGRIFMSLGEVVKLKENLMDAVTAVSGSGPAYYFLFTDILEKAGVSCGLNKNLARRLANATFIGAAESASLTDISMQDFVKKVASKGGTTEAALKIFKKKGLERIITQAVKAACNRSRQLSRNGGM